MNARSVGRRSIRKSPWFSTSEFTLGRNLTSVRCAGNLSNGAQVSFSIRNCILGRNLPKLQGRPWLSPTAPLQSSPLRLPNMRALTQPCQGLPRLLHMQCYFLALCLSLCCSPHLKWPSLHLSKSCISFRILLLLGSHPLIA